MANVQAAINVVVRGTSAVNQLLQNVGQLESIVDRINSTPLNIAQNKVQRDLNNNMNALRGYQDRLADLGRQEDALSRRRDAAAQRFADVQRRQTERLDQVKQLEEQIARRRLRPENNSPTYQRLSAGIREAQEALQGMAGESSRAERDLQSLKQRLDGLNTAMQETSQRSRKAAGSIIQAEEALRPTRAIRRLADELLRYGDSLRMTRDEAGAYRRLPNQVAAYRELQQQIQQTRESAQSLRNELRQLGAAEDVVPVRAGTGAFAARQRNEEIQARNRRRQEIEGQIGQQDAEVVRLERRLDELGPRIIANQERLRTAQRTNPTGLATSLNQLQAQAEALALVANNSAIASSQFNQFAVAAEATAIKLSRAQQRSFAALAAGFSAQGPARLAGLGADQVAGSRSLVAQAIADIPSLTRSEAALGQHISLLTQLKSIVPLLSDEYTVLGDSIDRLTNELQEAQRLGVERAAAGGMTGGTVAQQELRRAQGPISLLPQFSVESEAKRLGFNERIDDAVNEQIKLINKIEASSLEAFDKDAMRLRVDEAFNVLSEATSQQAGQAVRIDALEDSREIVKQINDELLARQKTNAQDQTALGLAKRLAEARVRTENSINSELVDQVQSRKLLANIDEAALAIQNGQLKVAAALVGDIDRQRIAAEKTLKTPQEVEKARASLLSRTLGVQSQINSLESKGIDLANEKLTIETTIARLKEIQGGASQRELRQLEQQVSDSANVIKEAANIKAAGGFEAALPAEEIRKQINRILGDLESVAPVARDAGVDTAAAFADGIRSGLSGVTNAVKALVVGTKAGMDTGVPIDERDQFISTSAGKFASMTRNPFYYGQLLKQISPGGITTSMAGAASDIATGAGTRKALEMEIKNAYESAFGRIPSFFEVLGKEAADRVQAAIRLISGAGGGPGGRGPVGPSGGPGDPSNPVSQTAEAMFRLGQASKLTNNQLGELEQKFTELRNKADATGAEFRQLTDDLARINREQARRDPNADFLTRRFGPRAAQGISEGLIGGAFPVLFGQGMGASLGGLVGGGAGGFVGGNLGFGLSLLGTALGSVFDQLNQAAQETGKSLNYPIEGFEKLKEAGLFASRQQEYYISKLIESGRTTEATAQIQAEMIKKIGVTGVNDLMRLGDASSDLSKAWAEFNLQLQAALAGPMAGLLRWLTGIVSVANQNRRIDIQQQEIASGLPPELRKKFTDEMNKIEREGFFKYKWDTNKEKQALIDLYRPAAVLPGLTPTKQDPNRAEADLQKQIQDAEKARALVQQGIALERSSADLRLSIEDTVYGLRKRAADMEKEAVEFRRSVEDQIFTKRQELETKLAENERKRQQNAIDALDLQFQKISTGLDPVTQGVVNAASEYLKIRAEGEADLQLAEKQLKLELQRIDQEVNRYKLQVEDRISQMAIQRDEFSRDVSRARLQIEREIGDYVVKTEEYRLAMAKHRYEVEIDLEKKKQIAAQEGLTVETKGGYTGTHVDGFPITSRPGRRKDPLTGEWRHHKGVDIAAPVGTALGYEIAGEVISAGWIEGYGNTLKVKLENGMEVLSAHLNEVFVTAGQKFQANQRLATVGRTGRSTGPHTHQESWMEGKAQPYASLPFLQLGKAVSGQASSDIYYVEGVGWFSKSTRKMVSGPGKAPASAQVTSVVTGAAPTPPSPPGMPALPGTPELVGVNDLMQQYVEIIERLKVATVDNNKAQVESNRIAAERAFLTMQERAMSPVRQAEQQTREIYEEIEARRLRNRLALEGYSPEIIEGEVRVLALQRDLTKSVQGYDLVLAKLIGTSYDGTNSTYESAIAKLKELEALGQLTPAQKLLREELEKILKARRGIIDATGDAVSGARGAAKESIVSPREKVEGRIGELKKELKELTSIDRLAITSADNIGNAFGGAFRDIITGAASTEEALGGFFKNVADSFAAMAVEIIAKQMTMIILQTILKALGAVPGGGGDSLNITDIQKYSTEGPISAGMFGGALPNANGNIFGTMGLQSFADGAAFTNSIVSSPTLFQFADGGVMKLGEMGEAGPEAVMPLERDSRGRLGVRASGLAVPFGRPLDGPEESDVPFQRKAVGLTVPFLKDAAGGGAAAGGPATIDVRFETVRIGDLDVVTRQEAQQIGRESAERGAQLAQRRMKYNPSVRRDIGIG